MNDPLAGLLAESRQRGFLGPGPVAASLAHALSYQRAVPAAPVRALDLGAGGGVPGLVLAARAWPATSWCLVDANQRRSAFLRTAAWRLGLGTRVQVVTGRAEVLGHEGEHRSTYDLVVARSFAAPGVTAECAAAFLAPGGVLVVSEPPRADVALRERWPAAGLAQLGLGPAQVITVAAATGEPDAETVSLAVVPQISPCPHGYPRRTGIPTKRPIF